MRRNRQRCPNWEKSLFLAQRVHGDGLLETELEQRFAWHLDLLSAREYLDARAGRRTCACADGRASAAAGNRADDRAQRRATANLFGCVRTAAFTAQRVVAADDGIILAVDDHARQFKLQFRTAG